MIVYEKSKLVIENHRSLVKKFARWFNEEDNRIKKVKIYSACMKQFIKICKYKKLDYNFNEWWESEVWHTHYGMQTYSKRIIASGMFKCLAPPVEDNEITYLLD